MRTFLFISVLFLSQSTFAQRFTIDEFKDLDVFTSLEDAMLNPDSVYRLRLRGRLREVPPEVFTSFPNLHELDLSRNRLKSIPPEIQLLKKLKRLLLFKNRIESLPPQIGELENLVELIINNNELVTLPDEIGNLKKLRYLDMWSNNISVLPHSMFEMKALQEVDLRVIVMTEREQDDINAVLPNVKVHMDKHCNCTDY